MTATPLIGVVADRKTVTAGAWVDIPNDCLPHTYIHAVEQAGGAPIMIPSIEVHLTLLDRILDGLDGLLLPGGRDLDAELYGSEAHDTNDAPFRIRDDLEIALTARALERGIPVFGACRGMQVMNVARGGTLEQHLGDRVDLTPHRDIVGIFTAHPVLPVAGTILAEITGAEEFSIHSHHHQGVGELGEGVIASAHAPDGVVEAIEVPGDCFAVGVQWHPEEGLANEGAGLFAAFIEAARATIKA